MWIIEKPVTTELYATKNYVKKMQFTGKCVAPAWKTRRSYAQMWTTTVDNACIGKLYIYTLVPHAKCGIMTIHYANGMGGRRMDRREFLKKTAALGIGAGVMILPKGLAGAARRAMASEGVPDLVALRGASQRAMFERGIRELGGIGRFVKSGQTVVIKPNMSWDVPREYAANTSPELVASIVRHCRDAGAKRVVVMDHSIEYWENTRKNSGIDDAIRSAGAVYAPSDKEGYYQNVSLSGSGKSLKEVMLHESLLECDVLISAPVLKHHGGAGVSISAKGLMGCVWDRRAYHAGGLQRCIADFLHARKPDLNVVDAFDVITKNGPRGGSREDVVHMGAMILSPDIVAADTASSMMLGRKQGEVEHIRLAAEAGFGEMDLSKLKISRISI